MGFYQFEIGAGNIADVSSIPGSSRFVAVIERNGFPNGHMWPGAGNPANRMCVVDLLNLDSNMVMKNKRCILNYHNIDDPWDTDGNGILKYAQTQFTNEALIVVDDYCIVAGTVTNNPWMNQFEIDPNVEFFQEVSDSRFMVVCFVEPIFNLEHPFLKEFGSVAVKHTSESDGDGKDTVIDDKDDKSEDKASDEDNEDEVKASDGEGTSDPPSSRSLMHKSTNYWHQSTLAFGGLILAAGGWLLAV
eukprot:356619_1